MPWEHLLAGAAVALAMTISGSAFAGSTMAPFSKTAARGQAIESVAAPATGDRLGAPVVVAATSDRMKLPPVASIRNGSDIRPFLRAGVPAEVKVAALRRAWSTDPAIRGFVGMTEDLP